jgi:hypothetical protein
MTPGWYAWSLEGTSMAQPFWGPGSQNELFRRTAHREVLSDDLLTPPVPPPLPAERLRDVFLYLLIALAAFTLLLAPKAFVLGYASWLKASVAEHWRGKKTSQEKVEAFAKWAAAYWSVKDGNTWSVNGGNTSPWRVLLRLPKPLRPDRHAIDFLSGEGWCNQLVSAAYWLFDDDRSRIAQHDLIFPTTAHSAISMKLDDGRWVYIDPYYGWLFKDGERLLSLKELKQKLIQGYPIERFAVPLKPGAKLDLYRKLTDAFDAKSFEKMEISIKLPVEGKKHWSVGVLDGKWEDTATAGIAQRLTSNFFYLGARFSPRFRLTYRLPDDGRNYEILIHLTRPVKDHDLPSFSIEPQVKGRTLRFHLDPEERALVVDSSKRSPSYSRPLRGVWYPIDQFEVLAVMK